MYFFLYIFQKMCPFSVWFFRVFPSFYIVSSIWKSEIIRLTGITKNNVKNDKKDLYKRNHFR